MPLNETDDYVELTKADREARRIASLAVAFENASGPLSNAALRRDFYSYCPSEEAARKAFQRDKQKLLLCGISLRPSGAASGVPGWEIDKDASYSDPTSVTADDALLLDIALSPIANDPAFPYSNDLRQALMKIDRSFSNETPVRISAERPHNPSARHVLEDCFAHGHATAITYQRADGSTVNRLVGVCGFFSLRGVTYFVAEQIDEYPKPPAHSYNVDRVLSAREVKGQMYSIPEDFDIQDFVRLPFQLGCTIFTAELELPGNMESIAAATMGRGTVSFDSNRAHTLWSVDVSSTDDAASWAIAYAMVPKAPRDLVDAWIDLLTASQARFEELDAREEVAPVATDQAAVDRRIDASRKRGRADTIDEVRQLVALVGALSNRNTVVTVPSLQARLGLSRSQAERLYTALIEVGTEQGSPLTLCSTDDGGLTIAFDHGTHGVPIRLTANETIAINAALNHIGVSPDDSLRQRITAAFGSSRVDTMVIRRIIAGGGVIAPDGLLQCIGETMAHGDALQFEYKGINDTNTHVRRVLPHSLHQSDTAWYLEAYDLMRGSERTFRLDRMTNASRLTEIPPRSTDGDAPAVHGQAATTCNGDANPKADARSARSVTIVFGDLRYARLFQWPGLSQLTETKEGWRGCIPFYGSRSLWLPRHIAACGGSVVTSDHEVNHLALAYVRDQLQLAQPVQRIGNQ